MNVVPSIRAMVMGFDRATTPASAAGTSVTERKVGISVMIYEYRLTP